MTVSPEIRRVIAGALLIILLGALDQTVVTTALPSIARDLGDVALLSWVVTANLITSISATALAGKLSDVYGRRPLVAIAIVIFVGASCLCAVAPTMEALIAFRALQGLGGGALITLAQTVVADVVSPRERATYSAYFSLVWAIASVAGPLLGGVLTELVGWRFVFWFNLPMGIVALVVCEAALRRVPIHTSPARIDYLGIAVLTAASMLLLLGLSWGAIEFGWSSLRVIVAFAAAVALGAGFLWWQTRVDDPLFPPVFWRDRVVGRFLPAIFFIFGGYLALVVTMPVFFKVVLELSPARIGVMMIPLTLSTTFSAYFAGRYVKRVGDYRVPPLITLPIGILGALAMAVWVNDFSAPVAAAMLMVVGFGVGAIFPVSVVGVQNAVAPREIGTVTGALGYVRMLGGAVWAAAATALVLALVQSFGVVGGTLASLDDLVRLPLGPAERQAAGRAFRWVFVGAALLLAVGLALCVTVESRSLRSNSGMQARAESRR
ncbi:MAG: MFS transporter [Alphaproteobacteria bacterium]|nr:MFS transporter [Alphaproteobacteria bacterium]